MFPRLRAKLVTVLHLLTKSLSFLRGGIVYKFEGGGGSATYYGKTKRHFNTKMCEHFLIYILTEIKVKGDDNSAIKKHHSLDFDDLPVFTTNIKDFKFKFSESCLTNRNDLLLNKYVYLGDFLITKEQNFVK